MKTTKSKIMQKDNSTLKTVHRGGARLIALLGLTFAIGLAPRNGAAQSGSEFKLYAQSAPTGVMLVIDGPALHQSSASKYDGWIGYHIYRRLKSDTLQVRVTEGPLSRIGSFQELRAYAAEGVDGIVSFIGAKDTTDLWNMIVNNDERIQSLELLLKPFRKSMGHLVLDTQVDIDSTYVYYCTQINSAGVESTPTDTVEVTVGVPLFNLLGPTSVQIKTDDEEATLIWTANPDDSGAFSFNIYRASDSAGYFQRLNRVDILALVFGDDDTEAPEMTFVDSTVYNQRTYYYSVVSVDYSGNESPRIAQPARVRDNSAPEKPENIMAIGGRNGIRVTWDKSSESDAVGYNIFRSLSADSVFVQMNSAPTPGDSAYYIDYTATLHRDYYYRVSAVDGSGNESDQSAQAIAMFHTPVRPLPPNGLRTESEVGAVKLAWDIVTDSLVRGYYIYRARSWGSDFTQVSELLDRVDSSWVDTTYGMSSRGTYMYALRSVTLGDQYSPYTEAVSGSPLAEGDETPQAPQSFFGHADIDGNRLFWLPPTDNSVFGYNVYRKPVYRAPKNNYASAVRLNSLPILFMTGHFTDTLATGYGISYDYFLRSVTSGAVEGESSHSVTITRAVGALLPPGGIRCLNYSDSVRIIWNATNQDNVDGYRVYRRSVSGVAELISGALITREQTGYQDNSISAKTRYYYSLSAVGANGVEGLRSSEIEVLTK